MDCLEVNIQPYKVWEWRRLCACMPCGVKCTCCYGVLNKGRLGSGVPHREPWGVGRRGGGGGVLAVRPGGGCHGVSLGCTKQNKDQRHSTPFKESRTACLFCTLCWVFGCSCFAVWWLFVVAVFLLSHLDSCGWMCCVVVLLIVSVWPFCLC